MTSRPFERAERTWAASVSVEKRVSTSHDVMEKELMVRVGKSCDTNKCLCFKEQLGCHEDSCGCTDEACANPDRHTFDLKGEGEERGRLKRGQRWKC